ncbi:MAG: hypothetical protein HC910_17605 [Spirulinaceae cyanobacterium SM2_1_0]|nr:hypothetical protein [Spirulinaceae cyanobacterium SM2_1_0]
MSRHQIAKLRNRVGGDRPTIGSIPLWRYGSLLCEQPLRVYIPQPLLPSWAKGS